MVIYHNFKNILYHGTVSEIVHVDVTLDNLGIQYFIGKQDVADKLIKELRLVDWR